MPLFNDARIELAATNYSAQARSVNLTYGAEELDDTAFGDDTRSNLGGLFEWSADIEFYADETTGGNTVDIFALIGTTGAVNVRPASGAISSTNPEYAGTGMFSSMEPVSGSVGDQQMNPVSVVSAGTLARNTT